MKINDMDEELPVVIYCMLKINENFAARNIKFLLAFLEEELPMERKICTCLEAAMYYIIEVWKIN